MKTVVYVDGQNFLYRMTEKLARIGVIVDKQEVNWVDLPYLLGPLFPGEKLEIKYYGVTKIRQQRSYGEEMLEKSIRFANNMRALNSCLKETGVKFCATGVLRVRDTDACKQCGHTDWKFQEKGVDVGLAVDMVKDVYEKQVEHLVLLSSDTDLAPAVRVAKKQHVKMTYVAFAGHVIRSLAFLMGETKIIEDEVIINSWMRGLVRSR